MTNQDADQQILVGIDPNDPSVPMLTWAADEAERRGLPLRLLLAVPPVHDTQQRESTPQHISRREQGGEALAAARDTVLRHTPRARVSTELLDGQPAVALCRRTVGPIRMIVVGSRGLSRAAEILSARSVAVPLSAQAHCPVVVVKSPEHTARHPARLVVGVDGSASSREAAKFAFEEADARHASVHAVWVWPRPLIEFGGGEAGLEERTRRLGEVVAECSTGHPGVSLTQEVRRGHPVEELARAASDALAVVVGRRGFGGYTGMRLGSVVHGLLHRAECPVITVPGEPSQARGRG
ncbi:universal stress protein [Streptomyces sp. NBC_01012]|uniref:universal stress protein n=1 Tax=Streptomyces sp. NBC_01012 TaxID=2903717 RepID=UPI0038689B93|nr:universal stress protein [Streptomyces sp. NBC_01012]